MTTFKKIPASKQALSNRKTVLSVGINDAWYATQPITNGKRSVCPVYQKWQSMLTRCYDKRYQLKQPTYIGCIVCDEWLIFSNFAKWCDGKYIKGLELDKDLKSKGNKIYSPETCLFVPHNINSLLNDCGSRSGLYPTGVSLRSDSGKFQAQISIDKRQKKLGCFLTPSDAYKAYIKAKNAEIMRKCDQYPEFAQYLVNHLLADEVV